MPKPRHKYKRREKPRRVYGLGGDLEVAVFRPRNPVEAVIGGRVKFRRRK